MPDAEHRAAISVEEYQHLTLGALSPLAPLSLRLLEARGCLLVEDVISTVALPPFDNSSMDGYAVRHADVAAASAGRPVPLDVVGEVAAGTADAPRLGPGQALRVMTGAQLPPGADAVVPVEATDGERGDGSAATDMASLPPLGGPEAPNTVMVRAAPKGEGAHVRRRGDDVRVGDTVLRRGAVLDPPQLGLLAAVGRERVRVRPRPRVVVVSTGSELVPDGGELGPGQISDSNSVALTAAAQAAGALAYRAAGVPDDPQRLVDVIDDQLVRADLVVTTGGVSAGAHEVVKQAFGSLGTVGFHKLAMQPGKPQGFGTVGPDGTPLFALPGNPVSAYVSFELFVRPAIRTLMGLDEPHRPTVRAACIRDLRSPAGRRQFVRARFADGEAEPVGGSGSHLVAALALADALIVVPEDVTEVAAGTVLDVILLRDH